MIVGDCMIIRYMDPWGRGGIIGNKIKGKDSNIHTSHTRNTEKNCSSNSTSVPVK